jgi:hypothetical protein
MYDLFTGLSLRGLIRPGESYILSEAMDIGRNPRLIEWLYLITTQEELMYALEMELCVVLHDTYAPKKFLRTSTIGRDCWQFLFLCHSIDGQPEIEYSIHLHRLKSFREGQKQIRYLFKDRWDELHRTSELINRSRERAAVQSLLVRQTDKKTGIGAL